MNDNNDNNNRNSNNNNNNNNDNKDENNNLRIKIILFCRVFSLYSNTIINFVFFFIVIITISQLNNKSKIFLNKQI